MSDPARLVYQVDALERRVAGLESDLRLAMVHMRRYRAMLPDSVCYNSCGVCGHDWPDGRDGPRHCACHYLRVCEHCDGTGDHSRDGCPPGANVADESGEGDADESDEGDESGEGGVGATKT
jgi:hypothetical protein